MNPYACPKSSVASAHAGRRSSMPESAKVSLIALVGGVMWFIVLGSPVSPLHDFFLGNRASPTSIAQVTLNFVSVCVASLLACWCVRPLLRRDSLVVRWIGTLFLPFVTGGLFGALWIASVVIITSFDDPSGMSDIGGALAFVPLALVLGVVFTGTTWYLTLPVGLLISWVLVVWGSANENSIREAVSND